MLDARGLRTTLLQLTMVALGAAIISLNYHALLKPNHIMPPGLAEVRRFFSRGPLVRLRGAGGRALCMP